MGWARCGPDSKGRQIGYAVEAICDQEGCNEEIDRGLAYACGNMHGETDYGCEKYFCYEHLVMTEKGQLCSACAKTLEEGQ